MDPRESEHSHPARRPLRLGVVAATSIDPWDAQLFPRLASSGVTSTILGTAEDGESVSTAQVERVRDFSVWHRIRLLKEIGYRIHGFAWDRHLGIPSPFAIDDAIIGLSRRARDFDVLLAFETYRASAYQACRDHPAVVVKVTENIPYNPHPWPYPWFRRSVRRRARRFICVSESARNALLKEGFDEGRIRVIPELVDTEVFRPDDGSSGDRRSFTVGYAANLDLSHGLPDLFQAFASLANSTDARLRIAGDGVLKSDLSSMVRRLGIRPEQVEYLGGLHHSEMPKFLRSIDLLCVPCRSVGGWMPQFGIVNIEAMASGRPIVATRVGATPEVAPPGLQRFLTPPGDIEALENNLRTLAEDRALRERLGREARDWVVERYEAGRVAAQWAALLFEVAAEIALP